MKKIIRGQSVAEYLIIMSVVLLALLSTGFLDKIKIAFNRYFVAGARSMTN